MTPKRAKSDIGDEARRDVDAEIKWAINIPVSWIVAFFKWAFCLDAVKKGGKPPPGR